MPSWGSEGTGAASAEPRGAASFATTGLTASAETASGGETRTTVEAAESPATSGAVSAISLRRREGVEMRAIFRTNAQSNIQILNPGKS